MANPYGSDALRSLNRILQYREQKEGRKVQEALQFMELAQTKSYREAQLGLESEKLRMAEEAQDFREIQTQLEVASKSNQQFMGNIAEGWIASAGLTNLFNLVPTGETDVDKIDSNIKTLTDKLTSTKPWFGIGKEGPGFSETAATEIVSALWNFKNTKDPKSVIHLARATGDSWNTMLSVAADPSLKKSLDPVRLAENEKLLTSFRNIGARPEFAEISNKAIVSLANQQKILKEQGEMAQGDYIFQSTLDFGDMDEREKLGESLNKVDLFARTQTAADKYEEENPEEFRLGPKTKTASGAAAVIGIGAGAEALSRQFQQGHDSYLKQLKLDGRKPGEGGLRADKFIEKYKVARKGDAFTARGRPTAQFMRRAKDAGREAQAHIRGYRRAQTGLAGAKEWAQRYTGIGGKAATSTTVGLALPFVGRSLGEAIGDQEGGMVGEAVGLTGFAGQQIYNQFSSKGKRSFISYITKKIPAIAGKAAAISMADSPVLPIADIAALGFTIYEIYDLYQEWIAGAE